MNIWDAVLIAAILIVVGLAVRHTLRTRRKGGCGCGCAGCTMKCDKRD